MYIVNKNTYFDKDLENISGKSYILSNIKCNILKRLVKDAFFGLQVVSFPMQLR